MKVCNHCGTEYEDKNKKCPSCGANSFGYRCPNCGEVFNKGFFCPKCGTRFDQVKKVCPRCSSVYYSNACPNCGYNGNYDRETQMEADKVYPKQKKNIVLTVIGWLLLTPVMATIAIAKSTKLKGWMKALLIVVVWLFYLIIALAGNG